MRDLRYFKKYVKAYKSLLSCYQFRHCNAFVYETWNNIVMIKSYNTVVAIADYNTMTYTEYGKWSRTTSKQVSQIYNAHFRNLERVYCDSVIDCR